MDKKNTMLLTVIAVATLLVAVVGATFAFFTAQGGTTAQTDVEVVTHTTDSATFTAGTEIALDLNQNNFGETQVGTNPEGTTGTANGSAQFYASTKEAATLCYTVKLHVTTNTFHYTGNNLQGEAGAQTPVANPEPELALTVVKTPQGGSATNLLTDYDITTAAPNSDILFPTTLNGATTTHELTATAGATVTDNFAVTVRAVNRNWNQNVLADEEAGFTGQIVYTKVTCPAPAGGE